MTQTAPPKLSDALKEHLIASGVWRSDCPVGLDRLTQLKVDYVDFDGKVHDDGELIVFDVIAQRTAAVLSRLLELQFPIQSIRSVHHFHGDDEASMAANNTSCFNYRLVPDSKNVSVHGYGMAIDVNPLQNPFITFDSETNGIANIHPPDGWRFLNRRNHKPGMVEPFVELFADNGFSVWGGTWTTPIDYHHFQPPRAVVSLLNAMNFEDGLEFFELSIEYRKKISERQNVIDDIEGLLLLCAKDKSAMFDKFVSQLK